MVQLAQVVVPASLAVRVTGVHKAQVVQQAQVAAEALLVAQDSLVVQDIGVHKAHRDPAVLASLVHWASLVVQAIGVHKAQVVPVADLLVPVALLDHKVTMDLPVSTVVLDLVVVLASGVLRVRLVLADTGEVLLQVAAGEQDILDHRVTLVVQALLDQRALLDQLVQII